MEKLNKGNKWIKIVFLIIFLISTSIFLATGQKMIEGYEFHDIKQSKLLEKSNKIYADNFFETDNFDNQILQNLIDRMVVATSNSGDYENESIENAKKDLSEFKDVKFFIKNNLTGKTYTNTNYESNETFRKNQKDYCNIEIDLNNNEGTYTKIIDKKRLSSSIYSNYFWVMQDKPEPISISISIPKQINNYEPFGLRSYQDDFKYSRNNIDILFKVLISSSIISIISLIACIKAKGKFINKDGLLLKIYRRIPIEIYIIGVIILLFPMFLGFSYIISIITKFIAITSIIMWII